MADFTLTQTGAELQNLINKIAPTEEKLTELESHIDNYKPIVINGNVTNAPDEEDITSEANLLKLKDRSTLNGMGYVILRKNKTFAEQVTKSNTIYEVRYNFDCDNTEITIPSNCVLRFEGGSLSNGVIVGAQTEITGVLYHIFNDITLKGSFSNLTSNLVWWGAKAGVGIDNSNAIQCALKSNIHIVEVSDAYYISSPISLPYNKIIKGRAGNNNRLTGFYANDNFTSKIVDFPARYGKDAFSQEVRGLFYHRDSTKSEMHDLFISARHCADFCIEHIDLSGSIDMYNCYIEGANQVGVLQYACENPVYDQLFINDCHIGMIISTNKYVGGNPLDSAFYSGVRMGMPNIISGKNVRSLNCNYGIIVNGSSDFKIDSLETARNSIIGAIIKDTYGELNKYYTEGDGRCNFYITADSKSTADSGYALQYIIDNNLDGVSTIATVAQGKEVYVRGSCLIWGSRLILTSAFMSVAPRSYTTSDTQSFEWMDNREPQGVDCCIINKDSTIVADTISVYILSNGYSYDSLFSVIVSLGHYSSDRNNIRDCKKGHIKSVIAPINQLYFEGAEGRPMVTFQHNVGMQAKKDLNWNIENSRRDFSYQKKDERSCLYYGTCDNRPLYYYGRGLVAPIWFTKAQVDALSKTRFCKAIMLIKVLKETSITPILMVYWYDAQYSGIYGYTNNVGGARTLPIGEYYLTLYFPIQVPFDYANLAVNVNLDNNKDYVASHLYLYEAEDGDCAPHNFTSVALPRGYTEQRPVISYEGQEFFDLNLHKMIYANSSKDGWIDASGASV